MSNESVRKRVSKTSFDVVSQRKLPRVQISGTAARCKGYTFLAPQIYDEGMNILFIIIIIVAIVLAVVGGLVEAVNFLLWVGIILLILAVIGWLIRSVTGNRG